MGIVRWGDQFDSFVMADLPGLIEGAHEGKGLGARFLRHIERTRMLLYAIDSYSAAGPADDCTLHAQLETLQHELGTFNPALLEKPFAVALTKRDLHGPDEVPDLGARCFHISAVSGHGIDELVTFLGSEVRSHRQLARQGEGG